MDRTRGALVIGLCSIVAVCGAMLYWLERTSAAPMDFIERYSGFSPDDSNGSIVLITVLGMIIAIATFRLASKLTPP